MTDFNRRSFLTLAASAALLPAVAKARDARPGHWDKEFGAFLAEAMPRTNTPGLSVAIVRKGQTLLARGYGLADIASDRPVTADTAFHIASVTKTVTATAMMMLLQDGGFGLDEPINKYLDFQVVHPAAPDTPVTFRHLMTHTSGISDQVYENTDAFAFKGDPELPLRDFLIGYQRRAGSGTAPMAASARCQGRRGSTPTSRWRCSAISPGGWGPS